MMSTAEVTIWAALFVFLAAWGIWCGWLRDPTVKACARWAARRRLPSVMRTSTPRDGGRGMLNPEDCLYACGGHLERTAASGFGLVVTPPEWLAIRAAQDWRERLS